MNYYMKRLLLLVLVLGTTEFSLQAQCWLSLSEKHLEALPDETLTIGKPDPADGRTVCYKWTNDDCSQCQHGPTDGPTLSVTMPSEPGGIYHFTVQKISDEGVKYCTVEISVQDDMDIESISPKRGCYVWGETPNKSEFEIITRPRGKEQYVNITRVTPENPNDDDNNNFIVHFEMRKDGRLYDTEEVTVEKILKQEDVIEVDLLELMVELEKATNVIENIGKIMGAVPGFFLRAEPEKPEITGLLSLAVGEECCVDKKRTYVKAGFNGLGCRFGARVRAGYNAVLFQLGGIGRFTFNLSFPGVTLTFNDCNNMAEVDFGNIFSGQLSLGLYGDILHEDIIHAEGTINGNLNTSMFKVAFTQNHKFRITALSACVDADLSYSYTFLSGITKTHRIPLNKEDHCMAIIK